jgi:hypothetical protein
MVSTSKRIETLVETTRKALLGNIAQLLHFAAKETENLQIYTRATTGSPSNVVAESKYAVLVFFLLCSKMTKLRNISLFGFSVLYSCSNMCIWS